MGVFIINQLIITTLHGKMTVSLGEYIYILLENKDDYQNAVEFLKKRSYKEAFINYGQEISYKTDIYSLNEHFKVDKNIKIKELLLENRTDYLNLINKDKSYNKLDINDVLELIKTKSGLFSYEKEYVGAFQIENDEIVRFYAKIKEEEFLKKLVNKMENAKIKVNSYDTKLINLVKNLGFSYDSTKEIWYKI